MTVLTLNGTQVFPDGKQQIKLVRENPYFTQSESYTLDVTLPMDILENRNFFQNIQRMEKSKQTSVMSCRLVVDNKPLLVGSAKVTQVTQQDVKVQLVGGRSEINLLSNENKTYIDEMDMGAPLFYDSTDTGSTIEIDPNSRGGRASGRSGTENDEMKIVKCARFPVYDETNDIQENDITNPRRESADHAFSGRCPQPNLNETMKTVLALYGYRLTANAADAEPWNNLYIASAKRTNHVAHTLPHWLVKDFITEYCRFFNCTLVVDELNMTVCIVSNAEYFGTARHVTIDPVDEYSVEVGDDAATNALAADNLSFDLSGSDCHDYDIIDNNIRDSSPTNEYDSYSEARIAYLAMSGTERLKYIFKTPIGRWCGWTHDYSDVGSGEQMLFTQIDVFAPLIRDAASESETSLKIVPVGISEDVVVHQRVNTTDGTNSLEEWTYRALSLENPTGNEYKVGRGDSSTEENEPATIQEYVEGDASIEKSEKEDRMQVFFVDDVEQDSICTKGQDMGNVIPRLMPFTDFLYKANHGGNSHRQWSLSLNPSSAQYYLGQLHQNNYTFNMKAKYCVKFLADEMPDPTQVFIIRNKRFGCEKIEASIDDQGLQKLMTGYFYEML